MFVLIWRGSFFNHFVVTVSAFRQSVLDGFSFWLIKTRIRESFSLQGYANRFSKGAVSSDGTGWVRFE